MDGWMGTEEEGYFTVHPSFFYPPRIAVFLAEATDYPVVERAMSSSL